MYKLYIKRCHIRTDTCRRMVTFIIILQIKPYSQHCAQALLKRPVDRHEQ